MNKNLYTNGFFHIFKWDFYDTAHLATSCGAPFENHRPVGTDEEKTLKSSVGIAGGPIEIQTEHLLNRTWAFPLRQPVWLHLFQNS
jgi:hypothetical protein